MIYKPRKLSILVFYLTTSLALIFGIIFYVYSTSSLFYNKKLNYDTTNYSKNNTSNELNSIETDENSEKINILVIADSHLHSKAFSKIKTISDEYKVSLIVHLGDHTDYGSKDELLKAKVLLESLGYPFIAIPGDRDLAAYGNNKIFFEVFKKEDEFSIGNLNLLFVDNSPNFTPLSEAYLSSILNKIPSSKIIFLSQPIFVQKGNIFENKYMGSLTAFSFEDENLLNRQKKYHGQRDLILSKIRNSGNKLIVAGDHHRSTVFPDPENETITYLINGATAEYLTSNGIKIKQESFQPQKISIISVEKNLKYTIKEINIFEK